MNPVVSHTDFLIKDLNSMYLNETFSDVTLLVESDRFPAHKIILANRSEYFRALFGTGMKESTQREIELKETSSAAVKQLLLYIYTGEIDLSAMDVSGLIAFWSAANLYLFPKLALSISDYLKSILTVDNFCTIFAAAHLKSMVDLIEHCMTFVDRHVSQILALDDFSNLPLNTAKAVVSRQTYYRIEVGKFRAVKKWIDANGRENGDSILVHIRLDYLTEDELVNEVRPSGLFSDAAILDAVTAIINRKRVQAQTKASAPKTFMFGGGGGPRFGQY